MAYTPPKVWYSSTINGTYTELTNIQSINITRGRQRFVDPFVGSQCVIELIPANSYALPLAIGQFVDVRPANSAASPCYFNGRITDIERSYGIPYDASATIAAPADRITITVGGATSVLGSQNFDVDTSWSANADVISAVGMSVAISYGVNVTNSSPSGVLASAQTLPKGTALMDVINQSLRTAQWVIDDADQERSNSGGYNYSTSWFPLASTGTSFAFADNASTPYRFNQIEYVSSVQQTFSTVVVEPVGLSPQAATSGTLKNGYTFSSYDATTTQAANLAAYVLLVGNQTTPVPFVVRTNTAVADGVDTLADLSVYPVGTAANILFRGTQVAATVQGWQFGFYLDMATVGCYLSASLGTPFTLDSNLYGGLDYNRLGYP